MPRWEGATGERRTGEWCQKCFRGVFGAGESEGKKAAEGKSSEEGVGIPHGLPPVFGYGCKERTGGRAFSVKDNEETGGNSSKVVKCGSGKGDYWKEIFTSEGKGGLGGGLF